MDREEASRNSLNRVLIVYGTTPFGQSNALSATTFLFCHEILYNVIKVKQQHSI